MEKSKLGKNTAVCLAALLISFAVASVSLAQDKQVRTERRPPAQPDASSSISDAKQPDYRYFSILNGVPMSLELHHDTEVGTNKPVDVYVLVIEMQVMNSDGHLEPIGLDFFNFYTAIAQDPKTAPNRQNGRDCRLWNKIITQQLKTHDPTSPTWPYIEFTVAQGARKLRTNEDGQVYWSDDVECWGSQDRFPPF
jgi:hypothetical protein